MRGHILFGILILFTRIAFGQEYEDHYHEHNHNHEIGFSLAPVYFINEQELSLATHFHYSYYFPHTKWGIGLGYEHIIDEHKHNFVGVELNYRPVHPLTLNISPGVAFEGTNWNERDFALHFETVYEFEFGSFHIGPVIELAYHPEDYHISLGIHIGLAL